MDARLFLAVLSRSKWLVLAGALLGAVLAVLAYGTPSLSGGTPTLKPRGTEVWQSESQLLITQPGFPYGRAGFVNQPTLAALSPVYATLANGSAVQAEIAQRLDIGRPGVTGSVQATEALDVGTSSGLPFVNLIATAPTRNGAVHLVDGAALILQAYVARLQTAGGVPAKQRIELAIVKSGTGTTMVRGPKASVAILVFLAVLIATLALVFLKEGARPRVAAELGRVPPATALEDPPVAALEDPPVAIPSESHPEYVENNGGDASAGRAAGRAGYFDRRSKA